VTVARQHKRQILRKKVGRRDSNGVLAPSLNEELAVRYRIIPHLAVRREKIVYILRRNNPAVPSYLVGLGKSLRMRSCFVYDLSPIAADVVGNDGGGMVG